MGTKALSKLNKKINLMIFIIKIVGIILVLSLTVLFAYYNSVWEKGWISPNEKTTLDFIALFICLEILCSGIIILFASGLNRRKKNMNSNHAHNNLHNLPNIGEIKNGNK